MVDVDGSLLGSSTIREMLSHENSDSGIVSDYNSDEEDTVSADGSVDFWMILNEKMREIMVRQSEVEWSSNYCHLKSHKIVQPSKKVYAAATGPEDGAKNIILELTSKPECKKTQKVKDCDPFRDWIKGHSRAYGIGTSLYDCNPNTNLFSGDPVADVFAVIAGENSCILALADGVNWGENSRLAARCAVAGCLYHLSKHLYTATTTQEIMSMLFKAFENAQNCIIEKNATMTTLCVAVICQLKETDRWGLCVVNVGDSLAFVYRKSKGVQEVTIGSHYDTQDRDMRDPGGSLGPVDGYNPDLRNLTFSFTFLDAGDIVFLTSDGVSDNFDPVVAQCNHCSIPELVRTHSLDSILHEITRNARDKEENLSLTSSSKSDQDIVRHETYDVPIARHQKMLADMTEVIEKESLEDHISALDVCVKLLSHVAGCTDTKRKYLEQMNKDDQLLTTTDRRYRRARDREISRHMRELPGKLDHAAVVAFEVGYFSTEPKQPEPEQQTNGIPRPITNFFRRLARKGRSSEEEYSNSIEMVATDSFKELYSLFGS